MVRNVENSIFEKRISKAGGNHKIELSIKKDDYLRYYEEINNNTANDIVITYLQNKDDDGRPQNVSYSIDKDNDIVILNAELSYEGNDHTSYID